ELASLMVGRQVEFKTVKGSANPTTDVLDVKDLVVTDYRGIEKVRGLNLNVRRGEIVGIAGIDGNGQSELIEAITGLRKVKSGQVFINGQDITGKRPRKITESGVGHIPQDRHKHGLVLDFPIGHNIALQTYYTGPISKNGFMNYSTISKKANEIIQKYDVRTQGDHEPARALSGGNQQKAIIGREIDRDPDLLIAALPTRGLDVGAIEFIHQRLIEQRDKGKA
ncbi:ATP-binding cassette domain-containing protein, partial [Leptospira santarosai]|nr:ATP-binding cassette domain-containing protein [Leptospira santarosai]